MFSTGDEEAEYYYDDNDDQPTDYSEKMLTSERYLREKEEEQGWRRRQRTPCCSSQTNNVCNNAPPFSSMEETPTTTTTTKKRGKTRVQRLLGCLFCNCDKGKYARQLLFELGRRANDYLPDLEDEQFFTYYKVLTSSLVGLGLFTLALSLWHYYF